MKLLMFRSMKRSMIIFFAFIIVFFCLLGLAYATEHNSFIDKMSLSLAGDIHIYETTVLDELSGVASDITVFNELISENNALILDGTDTIFTSSLVKTVVKDSLLAITSSVDYFDQIRIIDNNGYEIVRANYNNGEPFIVDESDLQDKSTRDYYLNTINLTGDFIYISRLDLNQENGMIEVVDGSYKPVLRFVKPIYSSTNEHLGILVVNYLIDDIFDNLYILRQTENTSIDILNADGYYLYSETGHSEFGFMFDDLQDETIHKYSTFDVLNNYSDTIYQTVQNNHIYSALGLNPTFIASSIFDNTNDNIIINSEAGSLIIYSDLDYTSVDEYYQRIYTYIAYALFSMVVAYAITRLLDEVDYTKKAQLNALKYSVRHDFLTELPNRFYIFSEIEKYMKTKERFSLMFLDLDGFKHVNDKFGHSIGDQTLIESANRIKENIRLGDQVARVGGDEFVILFNHLADRAYLEDIAKRILSSFKDEFIFNAIKVNIGISIGIAMYKENQSLDDLITRADKAMYQVKETSKNNYKFFE